ncbi:MAG: 4-phosphoerythronate dehydrogenase [Muribaculaceae bacterium]|nr:4-phosphoerythronate dehydrogenase [Muribaculaceae bacterium]
MKIVVERNIPYIEGVLEKCAEVVYLPYQEIDARAVKDADVLLVRTRNKCNAELLSGSCCKFIGTATIGTDHIDMDYCSANGITVVNAPGCNAPAVAQYVLSSIGYWMKKEYIFNTNGLTLGIVGVGHVGSIIARWAKDLGFKVLLNDPPLRRLSGSADYLPLSKLMNDADIITFHTPLTDTGLDATRHLASRPFINGLQNCRLLINCARGEIVDNEALVEFMETSSIKDVVIDCWEKEPDINRELLRKAFIATPHIAGYSQEGKMRATAMLLDSLARHFGWELDIPVVQAPAKGAETVTLDTIMSSYNPLVDTQALKTAPCSFEMLRNSYSLRPEVK